MLMDVNEYYNLMGQSTESDVWEMPVYNQTINGKSTPITGVGRKAAQSTSSVFTMPTYNDSSYKPIINNDKSTAADSTSPVYRPSTLTSSGVATPSVSTNTDVLLNCNFFVEIPGYSLTAGFNKLSGLDSELELEEIEEGGYDGVRYFPKKMRHPRIVLEYGLGSTDWLELWFTQVGTLGMIIRLPMIIFLMDNTQTPIKCWAVTDALPVKLVRPEFNAMTSEVAITRMEFVHGGIIGVPISL
jgi:phage tail-like protein